MQSSFLPLLQPDHLSVRVNNASQIHLLFAEVLGLPIEHAARGWDLVYRRMAECDHCWDLGDNIVLSMHAGPSQRMHSLLFRVHSLEKAKDVLKKRGLLGKHTVDELRLLPEAVEGLDFRFIEKF